MRKTLDNPATPPLYPPNLEAYKMLKGAIVGGPSLVFTRKHVVGETAIRSHCFPNSKPVKKILGYDANSLYPSTMLEDMPCGPGVVVTYSDPVEAAQALPMRIKTNKWFGFAEVDIEVPEEQWPKFEDFPPLFVNRTVPEAAIPTHMKQYLHNSGRAIVPDQRKLLGVMSASKILLYAPLLQWYIDKGLTLKAVYRTIDYKAANIFSWFVDEVTANRRRGDADPSKAIFADIFKLLGNSSYGKLIENKENQPQTFYCRKQDELDAHMRSPSFDWCDEVAEGVYRVEKRPKTITINRFFQGGIVVYQMAKLAMLEFYYEFLDRHVARSDFELMQMDTDSLYFALSAEKLEDVIKPPLREEFEAWKQAWLVCTPEDKRTPGLFKLEKQGKRMIALCSKCYYLDDGPDTAAKVSAKGVSQRQNPLRWELPGSTQIPARCLEVRPMSQTHASVAQDSQCSNRTPQEFLCSNRLRQVLQATPASETGRAPLFSKHNPTSALGRHPCAPIALGKYSKHNPASATGRYPLCSKHIRQVLQAHPASTPLGECCLARVFPKTSIYHHATSERAFGSRAPRDPFPARKGATSRDSKTIWDRHHSVVSIVGKGRG